MIADMDFKKRLNDRKSKLFHFFAAHVLFLMCTIINMNDCIGVKYHRKSLGNAETQKPTDNKREKEQQWLAKRRTQRGGTKHARRACAPPNGTIISNHLTPASPPCTRRAHLCTLALPHTHTKVLSTGRRRPR